MTMKGNEGYEARSAAFLAESFRQDARNIEARRIDAEQMEAARRRREEDRGRAARRKAASAAASKVTTEDYTADIPDWMVWSCLAMSILFTAVCYPFVTAPDLTGKAVSLSLVFIAGFFIAAVICKIIQTIANNILVVGTFAFVVSCIIYKAYH